MAPHRRGVTQALGIVHLLVTGEAVFRVGSRRRSAPQVSDLIDNKGVTRARQFTLKCQITDMQGRFERLQDRASKRRQIARDLMTEFDLKKLTAPDFTASIRPETPSLMVIDEAAVPKIYWEPRAPGLNRQELASELKQGAEIAGVALSEPEPVLSVRVR